MATLVAAIFVACATAHLLGIPTSPFAPAEGEVRLQDLGSIVVDTNFADVVDEHGQTLIPPTLKEFAQTFAQDLHEFAIDVPVKLGESPVKGSYFLTLGDPVKYRDAAGRESPEGYTLSVSAAGITITGASPLGVWWGTRTILQQAVLSNGSIPLGTAVDTPGWGTRGMMLDAGRHYYPPEFLVDLCAYMSYFKQNTFHLHLSDNLYNNVDLYTRQRSLELYARFRLWSDSPVVAGLNKFKNESYTRQQFDFIQSSCASRGVTLLPEIEAPGHALVFVQWKPELGLSTDLSLLNISNPKTIPTMKTVWSTFLPWFQTKTVHIGADEYTADVNDYNDFVNAMADHIHTVSNKSTRIWGTFPPKYNQSGYTNIYQNVSIQHWEYFEDNPLYDYIENNYTVLNSDDSFYVVNKWSGSYPQTVNLTRTFEGNPSNRGLWYPYIFDISNKTNNPLREDSLVLGEVAPLWNDYGPNSSVYSEAFYAWKDGIPALADKQWGGNLTREEFGHAFNALLPFIPAQNLERRVRSKSSTILDYTFNSLSLLRANGTQTVADRSGNAYDGWTDCPSDSANSSLTVSPSCSMITPLSSKGRNYTLTLSLRIDNLDPAIDATIIAGADSTLMLTPNITLFTGGEYYRLNTSIPLYQRVELSLIGRGNQTFAKIDTSLEVEFKTGIGINGEHFQWEPIAIEAPLKIVGGLGCGWNGKVFDLRLSNSI
ncbi:glycoside hydrolase superfamily [Lophiotrema nucula]|uniref:beta-N-acetylhexosaminidase n=1 Tax=Lophiotrema nucula TaxID=690887 RepID=A0A6A5YEB8_9PLEO|nr:glycoside hydrolase superfamily [Lophiotrema nucula]